MMTNFNETKLIRDRLGSPIPQVWGGQGFIPLTADMMGGSKNNSNIHISTEYPTNDKGNDGDLWIKHKEV